MSSPKLVSDPLAVDAAWLTEAVHARGVALGARVASFERDFVGTGQMGRNVRFRMEWQGDSAGAPSALVGKFPSDNMTSRGTGAAQGARQPEQGLEPGKVGEGACAERGARLAQGLTGG